MFLQISYGALVLRLEQGAALVSSPVPVIVGHRRQAAQVWKVHCWSSQGLKLQPSTSRRAVVAV
jgi:hypothetical protein